MSVVERLEKSLAFLKANGWTQGDDLKVVDGVKCYCARGAVIYGGFPDESKHWCPEVAAWHVGECAKDDDGLCTSEFSDDAPEGYDDVIEALDDSASNHGDYSYWSTIEFNDKTGRTKEQVVELFELAIERAKA